MPEPLTPADLLALSAARLEDADILYANGRYDGAAYLCGYAVELALKRRVCLTLGWSAIRTGRGYESFKVHDLDLLLDLSGFGFKIADPRFLAAWSAVNLWRPDRIRYQPVDRISPVVAREMVDGTRTLVVEL